MTRKLCICDLDGVVACSDARFGRATTNGRVNWGVAFDPELVALDTLIDGVPAHLERLERDGYTIAFLTSRPESMTRATLFWLRDRQLLAGERTLMLKPSSEQFTKTKVWKARMVAQFIDDMKADHTIVVEDEKANIEEIAAHLPDVKCFLMLEEAF